MRNFTTYKPKALPPSAEALVSIARGWKTIGLNQASFLAVGEPEAVELLFDESEKILGLRKVSPSESDAIPVRKQDRARNYVISSQGFASYFGLQADVGRRHPAKLEDGVLTVDLKEGGVEVSSTRSKTHEQGE